MVGGVGVCLPCDLSCKTCSTDSTTCLTCDASYPRFVYLEENKCVLNCPTTFYKDFNDFTCKPCDATSCPVCTAAGNSNCAYCVGDYY
jgi:proprotein convertase subtilisin/kexin type 5